MCYSKLMLSYDALKNNAFSAVHNECTRLHKTKKKLQSLRFFLSYASVLWVVIE